MVSSKEETQMTRGQLTIIYKPYQSKEPAIMTSAEFNGDMYMQAGTHKGYGYQVVNLLKNVFDVADYQYAVAKFNKTHHHYNDLEHQTFQVPLRALDFTMAYFENWFSDYIYIKNITDESVKLITEDRDKEGKTLGTKVVVLKPNAIAVLCFGKLVKTYQDE